MSEAKTSLTSGGVAIEKVFEIYKKEFKNFGFIPFPRLERDYKKGRFFFNDDGFVYIGSPRSTFTPIHAVYIYPEKRNGSPAKARGLLNLLPRKGYRVRCCFGKVFWEKCGLRHVGTKTSNARRRDVFILEGKLNELMY